MARIKTSRMVVKAAGKAAAVPETPAPGRHDIPVRLWSATVEMADKIVQDTIMRAVRTTGVKPPISRPMVINLAVMKLARERGVHFDKTVEETA